MNRKKLIFTLKPGARLEIGICRIMTVNKDWKYVKYVK